MSLSLAGKVALVTGASSGIGRAIALLLAAQGAAVVLTARRHELLEQVADEIRSAGGRVCVSAGDVARPETHRQAVQDAQREFGGLDIAVNNAGTIGPVRPLAEVALDEWEHTLNVNLTAAFLGARHQIPAMLERGGGALVFVSSFVGTSVGLPGMTAYGTSKAALMGLVKGITADYGAQGIRANALLPGGVDTEMAGSQEQKDWAAGLHAMKRIARADEIASAALFLASPMASFVTGSALYADGGNSAVK
ncbi:SDR family oxidoreductase [Achromobacter insolitus]|uniref:2,5-dichloro-2,5-cyclohexadiene-1,4-diol dehydrogenase n=1 Tax=Achromobacter insolitus TaxID=217204 RepID=A0A6S7EZA3_9BURK|nr:SDR family oxidoreductase [Achromobacter insolitus]APX73760.1 short-chain dehydrogenase [Achromobacter insolitus]OWT54613.1 short-chain dehydrogenase [Achromobacter insolitus]CAB3732707.1 2,5-dichloro-2,5-cyclohexadiene-1,4-diol dehydrogenase [Achromobacter insolitus]CAB3931033.1 2,5-dichloro-2,5-cyclohexadiene-1,4-diol dehydrogenase [Achromobacter insolitus]CAB3947177.1 2,5-dichloro-2,5-cyclohexadiene-1,4-diol dehydrogenase [Achromobacter insolitus]